MVRVYYGPEILEGQKEALDKINKLKELCERLYEWFDEPTSEPEDKEPDDNWSEDEEEWEEDWDEDEEECETNEQSWEPEDFGTWPEWSRELYSCCKKISDGADLPIDETLECITSLDTELYELKEAWGKGSNDCEYTVGNIGAYRVICVETDGDDILPIIFYTDIITEELNLREMKLQEEKREENWEEEW
jgi:hypothetical protein